MRRIAFALALSALSFAASGCTDYVLRRDSLDRGAGNAVNANIVTHMIDPWPRHGGNTDPTTSGERTARAVERYRTQQTSGAASTAPSVGTGISSAVGTSGSSAIR